MVAGWLGNLGEHRDGPREYYLLQSASLNDSSTKGAEPQDRAALIRTLLQLIFLDALNDSNEKPGPAARAAARSGRNIRHVAPWQTWARSLEYRREQVGRLGWRSSGRHASDEYIRCFCDLSQKVQNKVATECRNIWEGRNPDIFGECRMRETFEEYLRRAGVNEEDRGALSTFINYNP